ncbi:MAG TPA: hypothetical protein VF439_01385 [Candidatus Paceibacterota bacterium]
MESLPNKNALSANAAKIMERARELGHGDTFTPKMAETTAMLIENADEKDVDTSIELRMKAAAAEEANKSLEPQADLTVRRVA